MKKKSEIIYQAYSYCHYIRTLNSSQLKYKIVPDDKIHIGITPFFIKDKKLSNYIYDGILYNYLVYDIQWISLILVLRSLMISFIINISSIIWYRTWLSCHIIYRMSSSSYWNRIQSPSSINMTTIMILIYYSPRLNICLYDNLLKN